MNGLAYDSKASNLKFLAMVKSFAAVYTYGREE